MTGPVVNVRSRWSSGSRILEPSGQLLTLAGSQIAAGPLVAIFVIHSVRRAAVDGETAAPIHDRASLPDTPYFVKIDLGIMACTPLVPSTTWVTLRSMTAEHSM